MLFEERKERTPKISESRNNLQRKSDARKRFHSQTDERPATRTHVPNSLDELMKNLDLFSSVICHCANESVYGEERQHSQSQGSDEKTICAEQQNIRNCQHDYSTSPIKGHTDKMRRESAGIYYIILLIA